MIKYKIRFCVVLFMSFLLIQSNAFGQNSMDKMKIDIQLDKVTLENALNQIREQTGIRFTYSKNSFPKNHSVTIDARNEAVSDVLDQILKGTGLEYIVKGNSVIITRRKNKSAKNKKKYTVSGFVQEKETGEFLIGASVYFRENMTGVPTNHYGFYSITVEEGDYTLAVSYLGYKQISQDLNLNEDVRMNLEIEPETFVADEVVVHANREDLNISGSQTGTVNLKVADIKTLPSFMGEVDVLKTLQLFPGVQSAGEGNSGFFVRGGGPDQNLILLDEAVIYNPSHLFGFFSVFNSEALKDVNLIKGGMPANYGGRLSSVLDISMKEGNNQKFQAEGGLGLISSRLTLQGPIVKDTSSFIISARRTYVDFILDQFMPNDLNGSGYYFYDINAKLNYKFSDKDRVFLSGYFGKDVFEFRDHQAGFQVDIPWGNATSSLRWNHLFNDKLFMNTSVIYSNYDFEFTTEQSGFALGFISGIEDWNLKADLNYFPNPDHDVKFGTVLTRHRFTPNNASARSGDVLFNTGGERALKSQEASIYVLDKFNVNKQLQINVGIRYNYFNHLGPYTEFIRNDLQMITDTISYSTGEKVADYHRIEPRLSARYFLNDQSSLKGSFTEHYQNVHLASFGSVSLPTDTWVPSTGNIKPQFSRQYILGYFRNFDDNRFETSIEVYNKIMDGLIEYKDGALIDDSVNDNIDNSFTFGKGNSYGFELLIKKNEGITTGWIGYTYSKTTRQFADLNRGLEYPSRYDRRHDLSVVVSHQINDRLKLSSNFVFGTGSAVTAPASFYSFNGQLVKDPGSKNGYRFPDYHRLDISLTLKGKENKHYSSSWNFSVFNVYGRKNPYSISFEENGEFFTPDMQIKATQISLFTILPSVTWNFKFK